MKKYILLYIMLVLVLTATILWVEHRTYFLETSNQVLADFNLQQLLLVRRTSLEIEGFFGNVTEDLSMLA